MSQTNVTAIPSMRTSLFTSHAERREKTEWEARQYPPKSYLRVMDLAVGLLLNFAAHTLQIKRVGLEDLRGHASDQRGIHKTMPPYPQLTGRGRLLCRAAHPE